MFLLYYFLLSQRVKGLYTGSQQYPVERHLEGGVGLRIVRLYQKVPVNIFLHLHYILNRLTVYTLNRDGSTKYR